MATAPAWGVRASPRAGSAFPRSRTAPRGRAPQTGDHGERLLEPVEALTGRGERDAVGGVLPLVPPGADAELDPPAAHLVDLRHRDRERSRVAERRRRHQRPEPDAARVPGETRQRDPGVGGAGQPLGAHAEVVVGAEERPVAEVLRGPRDGEQVVVRRTLLRFGEDSKLHDVSLPRPRRRNRPATRRAHGTTGPTARRVGLFGGTPRGDSRVVLGETPRHQAQPPGGHDAPDPAGRQVPDPARRRVLAVPARRDRSQDCGLVYLVMADPDLREELNRVRRLQQQDAVRLSPGR